MALSLDDVRRRKWGQIRHAQALQHGAVAVPASGPASHVSEIDAWSRRFGTANGQGDTVPEMVGSADAIVYGQAPAVENLLGGHGPVIPGIPEDVPDDLPPLEYIPGSVPPLANILGDMPVSHAVLTPVWHDVVRRMFVASPDLGPWIGGPLMSRELLHDHVTAHVTAYLAAHVADRAPGNATRSQAIAKAGG